MQGERFLTYVISKVRETSKILLIIVTLALLIRCDRNKIPFSVETTGYPRQLTFAGLDHKGILSPDGSSIAFLTARNTYDPRCAGVLLELWIMNQYGRYQMCLVSKNETDLPNYNISVWNVTWFNDSRSLLAEVRMYAPGQSRTEIWRIFLDGVKIRLTSPDEKVSNSSLSPDGSRIAFTIQSPTQTPEGSPVYHLYTTDIDGTERILIDTGVCCDYTWCHDSQGLIYSIRDPETMNFDLWYASFQGNDKSRLSSSDMNEREPDCSSDNRFVAFETLEGTVCISEIKNYNPRLLLSNAGYPRWIPYANYILLYKKFLTPDDYWTEAWIVDLDGDVIRKFEKGHASSINFSVDGRYYVYSYLGNLWLDCFP